MNYQKLRHQYSKFVFDKFSHRITGNNLEISYSFQIPPDHHFTHEINFPLPRSHPLPESQIDNLVFHLGLSLIPSYWKTTCSPVIEITAGYLSPEQIEFWKKLLIKGMGEYFYKNLIDMTAKDFLSLVSPEPPVTKVFPAPSRYPSENSLVKVLVPIGGGKDSIVTLELLKPRFTVIPFVINPVPVISDVISISGLSHPIIVNSRIDPYLLKLNRQGYLNGHVPVSAFYAFSALLAANIYDISTVAFSDERSSDEGNVRYLDRVVNHQYSKTLEFETDLTNYLRSLKISTACFSFLRSLYELQITKLFCRYPGYFKVFSSCNQNFKLSAHLPSRWCGRCPKCVSTALILACFLDKGEVADIMGSYPPDLPDNQKIMDELLGNSPVKPFECVLTRSEARAAYSGENLASLLSSWQENPNLPEKYKNILKSAVDDS